jgi:hypothetical protein
VKFKIFVFLAFAIYTFNSVNAQLLVGPVFGGQYSWVSPDQKENKQFFKIKPKLGYSAGLGISVRVRKRFFLTSSFLYSTKGKIVEGKKDKLLRHEVVYRYIDIPIIYSVDFRAKVGSNTEFKYFVGLGPNISYWLGGKGSLYNSDYSENFVPELNFKIAFRKDDNAIAPDQMTVQKANRIQLGLNLAAGFVLEPSPYRKFTFLFRYELGHSFLSTDGNGHFPNTTYQDDLRVRNQGVRLSLSYMIDVRTDERKKGKSTIRKKGLH